MIENAGFVDRRCLIFEFVVGFRPPVRRCKVEHLDDRETQGVGVRFIERHSFPAQLENVRFVKPFFARFQIAPGNNPAAFFRRRFFGVAFFIHFDNEVNEGREPVFRENRQFDGNDFALVIVQKFNDRGEIAGQFLDGGVQRVTRQFHVAGHVHERPIVEFGPIDATRPAKFGDGNV